MKLSSSLVFITFQDPEHLETETIEIYLQEVYCPGHDQ